MSSVPSPPGCLRATSEFLFWRREGQQQMKRGQQCSERQNNGNSRADSVNGCTQCAYSHSGFSTPDPPVGCTGGLHGSGVDGRARRRKAGKRAVCVCLWRADACAQGGPVARTACVRYASSSGRARARSSARGQRDVAVCLTSSAASAFVDADQVRSSPLAAHCQGGRTL